MSLARVVLVAVAYPVVGALGMAGWWLAARPAAPVGASVAAHPTGAPRLEYPQQATPAELTGEARTTWRSAHLDGWKWRLGQCLDGQPAGAPPGFFPPGDHHRADGFRAGWSAAHAQVEVLIATLGPTGAAQFVRGKARTEARWHDPAWAVPPPPE